MNINILPSKLKSGTIRIAGHKHSFVQLVAASIVLNQICIIKNIPLVDDIFILRDIVNSLGGCAKINNSAFYLDPKGIKNKEISPDLTKKIHGSLYLIPALALRFGKLSFYETGGCQIGSSENDSKRPDWHIHKILSTFGTLSKEKDGYRWHICKNNDSSQINIQDFSDNKKILSGEVISSATKMSILCALLQKRTIIFNPYLKTDVLDLLSFLRKAGFTINFSSHFIQIQNRTRKKGIISFCLSDCPSEVISYTTLALLNRIPLKLKLQNAKKTCSSLSNELKLLKKMNIHLDIFDNSIVIKKQKKTFNPVDIKVTHRTIQSDHHPFFTLLLLYSTGISHITEFVWKNRFAYVNELQKLGAKIKRKDNKITIFPSTLHSSDQTLIGYDTRAAAVITFAAIASQGSVTITQVEHINRGYNNFWENLKKLNVNVMDIK